MAVVRGFRDTSPSFGRDVFLADTATVVGDVEVAEEVSLWYGAVLRGDVGKIRIGPRTNVQDNACIHMTFGVSDALIGSDVIIGHNAVVHGAQIADRVLIGMNSVVMDNAKVGEGTWIAAGSVVPPNLVIGSNLLVRGSPARVVRELKPEELAWAQGAVERYLELSREHLRQQRLQGIRLP